MQSVVGRNVVMQRMTVSRYKRDTKLNPMLQTSRFDVLWSVNSHMNHSVRKEGKR